MRRVCAATTGWRGFVAAAAAAGGCWLGGGAFLKIVDNYGFAFIAVPSLCTKVEGPMLNFGHIGDRCSFDGGHRSCADNSEQHGNSHNGSLWRN